jgi:hypothetical protein
MKLEIIPGSPNHERVHQLVRDIKAHVETIDALRNQAARKVNDWLVEVVLCGRKLNEAKEIVPKRQWMDWVAVHCPTVSHDTINKYMRVAANSERVLNSNVSSLREALHLLTEKSSEQNKVEQSLLPYLEALGRVHKLVGYIGRNPVREWPQEGREKLREDLEPIARELWPERFG